MKAKKKGGKQPTMTMKAVMFVVPEEFRTRIKDAAWAARQTIKGYIMTAIEEKMEKEEKTKKN